MLLQAQIRSVTVMSIRHRALPLTCRSNNGVRATPQCRSPYARQTLKLLRQWLRRRRRLRCHCFQGRKHWKSNQ